MTAVRVNVGGTWFWAMGAPHPCNIASHKRWAMVWPYRDAKKASASWRAAGFKAYAIKDAGCLATSQ